MQSLETLILSKVIKTKEASKASAEVEPGVYKFDFCARLQGELRKGEDFEQTMSHRMRFSLLAAIALSKVNKETRASILALYKEAVNSGSFDEFEKEIKAEAKEEMQSLAVKGLCNGKVTTPKLLVEVIGKQTLEFTRLTG